MMLESVLLRFGGDELAMLMKCLLMQSTMLSVVKLDGPEWTAETG